MADQERHRGEFRPVNTSFSPQTHMLLVKGTPRSDYRIEVDDEGLKIIMENLTYEELCHVQIVPTPRPRGCRECG
jgi:hypothetical protein